METWEIVLVLVLVAISLTMLVNQNVSMGLIQVLDSPLFQLVVVGLTLGVAVVSPPVAIVAVATIVVVYYLRNVIKVQMATSNFEAEAAAVPSRIRVEQTKIVVEVSDCGHQTRSEDADVFEAAMAESENRVPLNSGQLHQHGFKIPAPAPIEDMTPMPHENFPNPRGSQAEGFESADPKAETRGLAPAAGSPTYISAATNTFPVDPAAFLFGDSAPQPYNEALSPSPARPYNESAGQYAINRTRPYSGVQKRELAEYMAGSDVGSNEYVQHGDSIDDKIRNLQNGITTGDAPPPNFDQVTPPYNHSA